MVARREVRGEIDPETDHALVNVIHPGNPRGRRRRKIQAKREMVSGESQSVEIICVHVFEWYGMFILWHFQLEL